jgi:predicted RNase H-like nuclease
MTAWGVDGCKGGWVAVSIDSEDSDNQREFKIFPEISTLAASAPTMLYIDIPIGLPKTGYRGCDQAARDLLKEARSRVFLGLRRPLLNYLNDYPSANAWAKSDSKGLAKQSFSILKKIAEVDDLISPERQRNLRESHPELVFWRLNGGTALLSKHKPEGLKVRHDILVQHGFVAIDQWLLDLRVKPAKPDDLFDACALALAARDATQGSARRVKCPEVHDTKGLRMEIWF